nr:HupE/UreJ family protein [uncultured Rhodopila sp.]
MRHAFRFAALSAFAMAPAAAFAHPGTAPHDHAGFLAGVLHPLTGADHLAAMVAVGLWAAALGGRAIWAVPASFVGLLAIGAVSGVSGIALPAVEPMIAVSVIALGLAVAFRLRVAAPAAAALVGVFAVFHGHAHGAEMPALASPLLYGLGFVLATAALHGAGIALGLGLGRTGAAWLPRIAGHGIAAFGALLLVAG